MSKNAAIIIVILVLAGAGYLLFKEKVGEVSIPNNEELPEVTESETLPGFTLPAGFVMSIYADNIAGARDLELDPNGNLWVSQTKEGQIKKIKMGEGKAGTVTTVYKNLDRPHGLAIDNTHVYFAEETRVSRAPLTDTSKVEKIVDLPAGGGGHFTRSLLITPQDTIYVSIGSTCNVCNEEDERNAAIYEMNKDGSNFHKVAKGLRNAVFMTIDPVFGKVFATEMGRDNLGDNLPPDEINIIEQNNGEPKNYGWPICYGKNIHDGEFDKNTYIRNPCMEPFETPSFVDLQAHSAPLGLAFIPEEGYPEDWWYDLLVAYHGSWNRSTPTGYKIVRLKMDAKGKYSGTEDFITGWLTADGKKLGRPVDIMVFPGGTMYISDDEKGVIYRVAHN